MALDFAFDEVRNRSRRFVVSGVQKLPGYGTKLSLSSAEVFGFR